MEILKISMAAFPANYVELPRESKIAAKSGEEVGNGSAARFSGRSAAGSSAACREILSTARHQNRGFRRSRSVPTDTVGRMHAARRRSDKGLCRIVASAGSADARIQRRQRRFGGRRVGGGCEGQAAAERRGQLRAQIGIRRATIAGALELVHGARLAGIGQGPRQFAEIAQLRATLARPAEQRTG